jgi:hypothetical protein
VLRRGHRLREDVMTQTSRSGTMSPLAPFRHRAFFWLWLGVVISSVGLWAQTVGAQWLFVHDPNAATIVTLVQTASTLPMMLLALPAGVLADAFDRRWLMFGVQTYFVAVALLLAVLTAAGLMPPALLLAFTFAVGAGQAMLSPSWQALESGDYVGHVQPLAGRGRQRRDGAGGCARAAGSPTDCRAPNGLLIFVLVDDWITFPQVRRWAPWGSNPQPAD